MSIDFNNLDRAVFFTLVYSDLFNFPLTFKEIQHRLPKVWDWEFLIGQSLKSYNLSLEKNPKKISASLKRLIDGGLVEKKVIGETSYFFLKGCQENLHQRFVRRQYLPARNKKIAELLMILQRLPFIRAVILTGSSAVKNAELADDLDFCLITSVNTLWLSRFIVIILAKILGKQVQIDVSAKASNHQAWCFNMWLDDRHLNVLKNRFSIYQAYEVQQMQWLLDKDHLKEQFYRENQQLGELIDLPTGDSKKSSQFIFDFSIFFWPINLIFYLMQIIYRQIFFGRENFFLNLHQAYFNNIKRQEQIFKKIKRKMKRYGLLLG